MATYNIPLSNGTPFEPSKAIIDRFFISLSQIPAYYLNDIISGYNRDYKVVDKESAELLKSFVDNRNERNDKYFGTVDLIIDRIASKKPLLEKKAIRK